MTDEQQADPIGPDAIRAKYREAGYNPWDLAGLADHVPALLALVEMQAAALARSDRLLAAFTSRDIVTHGSTGWRVYTPDGCTLCDTLEAAWRVLGIVEEEADATR